MGHNTHGSRRPRTDKVNLLLFLSLNSFWVGVPGKPHSVFPGQDEGENREEGRAPGRARRCPAGACTHWGCQGGRNFGGDGWEEHPYYADKCQFTNTVWYQLAVKSHGEELSPQRGAAGLVLNLPGTGVCKEPSRKGTQPGGDNPQQPLTSYWQSGKSTHLRPKRTEWAVRVL